MDLKVTMAQAISSLDDRMQLLAKGRFLENQSLSAIAEELGISPGRAQQIERKMFHILIRKFAIGQL